MQVKRAVDCPECEKAKNIDHQPLWWEQLLKAINLPPMWVGIGLWVFFFIGAWPSIFHGFTAGVTGLGFIVGNTIVAVVVGLLVGLFLTYAVFILLSIPSVIRNNFIGWPATYWADHDGTVHVHLGHNDSDFLVYWGRIGGCFRTTSINHPDWRVKWERNRWVRVKNGFNYFRGPELIIHRDQLPVLLRAMTDRTIDNLPDMVVAGSWAYQFCGELGDRLDKQHQQIVEDPQKLGRSGHGRAMRQFIVDLLDWAHRRASNRWPSHTPDQSPFAMANDVVAAREEDLVPTRPRRRPVLAEAARLGTDPSSV